MKNHKARVTSETLAITRYYSFLAFAEGLHYPKPNWINKAPKIWIKLWKSFFAIVEFTCFIHLISCVVLIILEGTTDIGVRTECVGSLALIIESYFKSLYLYKKRVVFDNIVKNLNNVSDEFLQNPVKNDEYFAMHKKRFTKLQHYCAGKWSIEVASLTIVYCEHLIKGFITDDPKKRLTPMLGWFPLDYSSRFQFFIASTSQTLGFYALLGRSVATDAVIISLMAVLNNHLLYLATLLGDIIDAGPHHTPNQRRVILGWWIHQHKQVLNIYMEFRKVVSPLLFANYAYVSTVFFLALFRLTGDNEFNVGQQSVIIGINLGNLLHLYIMSALADNIADNSMRISLELARGNLWLRGLDEIKACNLVGVRCTKPIRFIFADNRALSVTSFLDIVTSLMSYFVTIYQLRN